MALTGHCDLRNPRHVARRRSCSTLTSPPHARSSAAHADTDATYGPIPLAAYSGAAKRVRRAATGTFTTCPHANHNSHNPVAYHRVMRSSVTGDRRHTVSKSKWFVVALSGLLAITLVVSAGVFAQGPRNGGVAPNAQFQDEDGDGLCDLCGQEPVGRGGWAGMGGWMMGGRWGAVQPGRCGGPGRPRWSRPKIGGAAGREEPGGSSEDDTTKRRRRGSPDAESPSTLQSRPAASPKIRPI